MFGVVPKLAFKHDFRRFCSIFEICLTNESSAHTINVPKRALFLYHKQFLVSTLFFKNFIYLKPIFVFLRFASIYYVFLTFEFHFLLEDFCYESARRHRQTVH